jgi:hypothetical protein
MNPNLNNVRAFLITEWRRAKAETIVGAIRRKMLLDMIGPSNQAVYPTPIQVANFNIEMATEIAVARQDPLILPPADEPVPQGLADAQDFGEEGELAINIIEDDG